MRAPIYCSKYLLPALVIGAGCGDVTLGEHTYARCVLERVDDDGDGKVNCEDPDCQVFAECRDGGVAQTPTAGSSGAGSGADDCGPCADGQVCHQGACAAIGEFAPGPYTLMIEMALVPASDAAQVCFDIDRNMAATSTGECNFAPDPYVSARIEHPTGAATALGTTETRPETTMPVFMTSAFDIELGPADRIVLEVFDSDSPDADDLIFGCTAHKRSARGTKLDCIPADITRVARGDFRVEASLLPK